MAIEQESCEGYSDEGMAKLGVPFAYSLLKSKSIQGHNSLFIKYQEELQKNTKFFFKPGVFSRSCITILKISSSFI